LGHGFVRYKFILDFAKLIMYNITETKCCHGKANKLCKLLIDKCMGNAQNMQKRLCRKTICYSKRVVMYDILRCLTSFGHD